MTKRLQDMTLEELWELFPIVLAQHDNRWCVWAEDEMKLLSSLLVEYNPVINHIGSTAIPDIQAKPIIDILVEVSSYTNWLPIIEILESNGYICMSRSDNRISFNKGYTITGYADKVFHIHIHQTGDNNEIIFRDYLCSHPDIAKRYEELKISLLPKYKHNRDGYTQAKTKFINDILLLANQDKNAQCNG